MAITFTGKAEAVAAMDGFGARGTPFLFIASFTAEEWFVAPLSGLSPDSVAWAVRGKGNSPSPRTPPPLPALQPVYPNYGSYLAAFTRVQREIAAGNTYLLNLSA